MSNTPTLMQSEERELNRITSDNELMDVDVTISITMSKTVTIKAYKNELNDDHKLMTEFDSQKYSIEQIQAILEEYKKNKSINNFQTKLKDLSNWVVDEKCITTE